MENMPLIYLIGLLLITIFFSFAVGWSGKRSSGGGDICAIITVAITWPAAAVIIAYLCIIGGSIYLGERLQEKIYTSRKEVSTIITPNVINP